MAWTNGYDATLQMEIAECVGNCREDGPVPLKITAITVHISCYVWLGIAKQEHNICSRGIQVIFCALPAIVTSLCYSNGQSSSIL